ncbi:hypothetical protein [Halalkalirubrum salinum]|uniref:hypothetical protein n=1 Tax=Halalkalirubrum salinum TaxID=2563889 RepID=UPI0010FB25ED|nr:hypothetical protein [Halalkalirubrum salinum]
MEEAWLQHLFSVIGLSLGTLGAAVVLAADWSTVENFLIKIGRRDRFLYRVPLLGYPFRQAKRLADLDSAFETVFLSNKDIHRSDSGFQTLKRVVVRVVNNDRLNLGTFDSHKVNSTDFEQISLNDFPVPLQPGDTGGLNAYCILYDSQDNSTGWIRTGSLRNATVNYSQDLVSKAGASLFIGGFFLQLISELVSIPVYPTIRVPHVVVGVVAICIVLAIPGICEQMDVE